PQRLRAISASEQEKIVWLRAQAELGHVPLQYELAVLVFPSNRSEALKWYARGRLARTLDGAECKSPTASLTARVILDNRAAAVRDAGAADAAEFQAAIADALSWEASRTRRPSPEWICGAAEAD